MIKPKFEDFDYGEGRKDLSWCQYARALEEYVTLLEAENQALRQPPVVGRSEQLVCPVCKSKKIEIRYKEQSFKCKECKEGWAN